jgi:hypothetical protein
MKIHILILVLLDFNLEECDKEEKRSPVFSILASLDNFAT